jgi:hypothetical protein
MDFQKVLDEQLTINVLLVTATKLIYFAPLL